MNSSQKKTCDRLWQIKVTGGQCSMPGCNKEGLEGHHVMKRRYLNTRWSIENGRALCRTCHVYVENNPEVYEVLIVSEIGEVAYDLLRQKAFMVVRQDYNELRKMLSSS